MVLPILLLLIILLWNEDAITFGGGGVQQQYDHHKWLQQHKLEEIKLLRERIKNETKIKRKSTSYSMIHWEH